MVSDTNLSTDIWTALNSKLVGSIVISKQTAPTSTVTASVVASYNDKYPTRPIIELVPITSDESLDKFGGTEGRKNVTAIINCYAKNTYSVDQMRDQIKSILKVNDIPGIDLISISDDYGTPLMPNDIKFHLIAISANYLRE